MLQKEGEALTISELSLKMGISLSRVSELAGILREKGFVEVTRRKKKKLVFFADTKHAQLIKDLVVRHSYMDFSGMLSGKAINVLWLMDKARSISEISRAIGAYRASVYRIITKLLDRGVMRKRNAKYSLNSNFSILNEFARETIHYLNRKKAETLSPGSTIVWERLQEFIVKAPVVKEVEGFHLTGPSRLGDYGVPLLLTNTGYYFYSEKKEKVDLYDVVVHTLLIDPRSTRYITYLLILLAKNKVDVKLLLKKAEDYGVNAEAKALLEFLRTKGKLRAEYFPSWKEFCVKALDYGVEA
jgi:DNA-binding transcriptional regulator GbsR (MarR family)